MDILRDLEPSSRPRGTPDLLDELKATRPLTVTRAEEIQALREWAEARTARAS